MNDRAPAAPPPPGPPPPPPAAPSRRSIAAPLALGAALVVLGAVAVRRALAPREEAGAAAESSPRGRVLADYGEVVEFELVDQQGRPFTRRDLAGRIWVLDFFFTTCPGPCIELTAKMRNLVAALRHRDEVGFLSVSVDPKNDTPSHLASYARSSGGDFDRWRWLTGDVEQVKKLCRNFMAAFGDKDSTGDINHSTRIHVIDRAGRLRAIHDTQLDEEWKPAVLHSVNLLLAQQPGERRDPE